MATAYRRGADFERRVMKRLEEMGVSYCMRTAGSHTPVDIVAFWRYGHESRQPTAWFIQCKSGKTKISRKEFGVSYGPSIADEVSITINVQGIKEEAPKQG